MDIAELAARLAEKSKKKGEPAASHGAEARTGAKDTRGRAAQHSTETRSSIAKKAAAGRRSLPRTTGK
jgi:hypothetical protein